MLFSKLMPKEGNFFELFNRHAEHVVEAAQAFGRLVEHYGDAAMRQQHTREVDGAERVAALKAAGLRSRCNNGLKIIRARPKR